MKAVRSELLVTICAIAIANAFSLPASAASLSIQRTTLPSCIAKAPCAMVLVGTGGNRNDLYEWSIASGSLPAGMKIDSTLGAIYTTEDAQIAAGTYSFTVRVQDASGATAIRTFSLAVKANSTSGVAVGAPQKLSANTTYIVTKDLVCAETCFAFNGDNATLDCNGHKLIYNTSGTPNNYGVAAVADWDTLLPIDRSWTGRGNKLTVKNCRIEESDSSVAKSHGIRMGQGGVNGITILNTQVITKKRSSEPFYGSFSQNHTFKQNIFYNRSPNPGDRTMLEGVSVRRYGSTTDLPNLFEDNVLIGSPQGGVIFSSSPSTVIRRNAIKLTAVASNAFGVYVWNKGVQVYDNTIDNYADDLVVDGVRTAGGRGIQIDFGSMTGLPVKIYHNMIRVREVNRDAEYKGCVLGGAFGVQFEKGARNSYVSGNTIVAVAKECRATALRVTSSSTPSATNYQNIVYGNVVAARRIGSTSQFAVGLTDAYGQWLSLVNNKFIVDTAVVGATFDKSVGQLFFSGNTFAKGKNPSSKWALWGDVGACLSKLATHSFVDNKYAVGASEISSYPVWNHSCAGTGDYKKFKYRTGYSYHLTVTSSSGAVSGATITVKDNTGRVTFTGKTDSSGKVLASIYTRSVENSNSLAKIVKSYTNTVTLSKAGCTTKSYSFNPTGPITESRTLGCE